MGLRKWIARRREQRRDPDGAAFKRYEPAPLPILFALYGVVIVAVVLFWWFFL
ncbi:MAG: hypothetical protein KGH84_13300 [Paracoccaceae bacterium]|nr:hypothetical protein [Paracoccaceae bacterium]